MLSKKTETKFDKNNICTENNNFVLMSQIC